MNRVATLLLSVVTLLPSSGASQAPGRTPVLITSDEECRLSVDGDDLGTIPAAGLRKIEVVPGEHLVTAVCPGDRRWRDTVTVAHDQRVVTIPGPGHSQGAPAAAPAAAPGRTGCLVDKDPVGRWIVLAVVVDGPCDAAGAQPGSIVLGVDGRKMKDVTAEELQALDEGPTGSTLEAEILDRDGDVRTITLTRATLPEAGHMRRLGADGHSIETASFDAEHPFGSVPGSPAPGGIQVKSPLGLPPGSIVRRTCGGFATPCAQRGVFACNIGVGCAVGGGSCGGYPTTTCYGKNQFACGSTKGCLWVNKTCSGSPTCTGYFNQWACNAAPGCSWKESCTGFAVACSMLDETSCVLQPGCFLQ